MCKVYYDIGGIMYLMLMDYLWYKINPFVPNGIPHLYQLNESNSNFRAVG